MAKHQQHAVLQGGPGGQREKQHLHGKKVPNQKHQQKPQDNPRIQQGRGLHGPI